MTAEVSIFLFIVAGIQLAYLHFILSLAIKRINKLEGAIKRPLVQIAEPSTVISKESLKDSVVMFTPEEPIKTAGERLKELRESKGLSRTSLAAELGMKDPDVAGRSKIARLENGQKISKELNKKIQKKLDTKENFYE